MNRYLALVIHANGYETGYDHVFHSCLKAGDRVWDVGANVGYYTTSFSEKVSFSGRVYAFEPSPVNLMRLYEACTTLENVQIMPFGLGDRDGEMPFAQGADDLGALSRIIEPSEESIVNIRVERGDGLILKGRAEFPNALKIDVEGFELEVLSGFHNTLLDKRLRVVGIEVHFGILKARGFPNAPRDIENLLLNSGFIIKWPDSSHILGTRL